MLDGAEDVDTLHNQADRRALRGRPCRQAHHALAVVLDRNTRKRQRRRRGGDVDGEGAGRQHVRQCRARGPPEPELRHARVGPQRVKDRCLIGREVRKARGCGGPVLGAEHDQGRRIPGRSSGGHCGQARGQQRGGADQRCVLPASMDHDCLRGVKGDGPGRNHSDSDRARCRGQGLHRCLTSARPGPAPRALRAAQARMPCARTPVRTIEAQGHVVIKGLPEGWRILESRPAQPVQAPHAGPFELRRVSALVSSPRNDVPEVVRPVDG